MKIERVIKARLYKIANDRHESYNSIITRLLDFYEKKKYGGIQGGDAVRD